MQFEEQEQQKRQNRFGGRGRGGGGRGSRGRGGFGGFGMAVFRGGNRGRMNDHRLPLIGNMGMQVNLQSAQSKTSLTTETLFLF